MAIRAIQILFELRCGLRIAAGSGNRLYSASGSSNVKGSGADKTPSTDSVNVNVPGLSRNVCDVPNTEVGPGASKKTQYKNPEYFCYNSTSYFEAEIEMLKYRCPQPSSKVPLTK